LDDFSALVILLSLASLDANLWRQYNQNNDQCLILREADLAAPDRSELLLKLSSSPDTPVRKLASIVRAAAKRGLNDVPRFATILQDSCIQQILTPSWRPSPLKTDIDVEPAVRCARCRATSRPSDRFCRSCSEPIKLVNGESSKVIDRRFFSTGGKEFTEQERHEQGTAAALPKPRPSSEPQTDDGAAKWRAMLVTITAL